MKTKRRDLTTNSTAGFSVTDFRDGNERKSWAAARCRIHGVVLDSLAILAKSERSLFVDCPTKFLGGAFVEKSETHLGITHNMG